MNVLIVHDGFFPRGTAFAVRLVNFARLFDSIGFKTHIIASYSKDSNVQCGQIYNFENCTYEITDGNKAKSIDSFIGPKHFMQAVDKYLNNNDVKLVFTSRGISYIDALVKKCASKHIPCVVEQCEWLDISSFKFRWLDYRYLKTSYLLQNGYKKVDGIIAISRLLEKHFVLQDIQTIRIPVIIDVINTGHSFECNMERLKIVFTGNLGQKKELLYPIISALATDDFLRSRIEFHIYGPTKQQVVDNIGDEEVLKKAGDSVTIHGYIEQEKMHEIQKSADFQYFVRPHRKSSNAGFPTKLVESMSVGTPVITNCTGDIPLCVENGVNGYVIEESTKISEILHTILRQDLNCRKKMRMKARETAEEMFDYRLYKGMVYDFFNLVMKGKNTNANK